MAESLREAAAEMQIICLDYRDNQGSSDAHDFWRRLEHWNGLATRSDI